jgi:uncharacterized protein YidB (DUF937 family)
MGMLDSFMKNPEMIGDAAKFAMDNPQIAKAAMGFLSSQEGSAGGSGGLGEILSSLQAGGLGDTVSSWLGSGANKGVSPGDLQSALGPEKLSQFAEKAGVSTSEASSVLAGMLPGLVDKLSPNGKLPDAQGLSSMLGGLMGSLKG